MAVSGASATTVTHETAAYTVMTSNRSTQPATAHASSEENFTIAAEDRGLLRALQVERMHHINSSNYKNNRNRRGENSKIQSSQDDYNVEEGSHVPATEGHVAKGLGVYVAMSRQDICEEFGVALRDLRTVDPGFRNQIPVVLVRKNALLISMNDVKAIITKDRMLIFDYQRQGVKRFIGKLRGFLQTQNFERTAKEEGKVGSSAGVNNSTNRSRTGRDTIEIPFELRALEASMDHVCNDIERSYHKLHVSVSRALHRAMSGSESEEKKRIKMMNGINETNTDTSSNNTLIMRDLESLLLVKHKLRTLYMDCKEASEAIQELLNNDEDLDGIVLMENCLDGGQRLPGDHAEAEMMLENYLKRVWQVRNDIIGMRDEISASDEHMRMALDNHRNSLLQMSLTLNMFAVSISSGAIIPAIFGMNLVTNIEHNVNAFGIATGMSFGMMMMMAMTMMAIARRYKIDLSAR